VVLELLTRLSSLLEEVGAEPDFLQMGLVGVLRQDLLNGHLSFRGAMHAQPDQTEPPSSEQSNPLEVLGEAFSKLGEFICSEVGLDIERTLLPILIIELYGFFLLVLALTSRGALLDAFGVLLLLPIK
jgi:hypothetical protein